jgi:hypothetical protein
MKLESDEFVVRFCATTARQEATAGILHQRENSQSLEFRVALPPCDKAKSDRA